MSFWPAPGRMGLASKCGFPWSDHAPRWPKREFSSSPARAFGEAFGRAIEGVSVWGFDPKEAARAAGSFQELPAPDILRLELCVEHASKLLDPEASFRGVEFPVLFNVDQGTAGVANAREDAFRPPSRHLGSVLDLVEVSGGRLIVTDWKTGYRQAQEEDIRDSWQLRAYGLFAARAFGASEVTVRLVHVNEERAWTDPMDLDELELAIIESDVRGLLKWLAKAQPPRRGRHCYSKYCPILSVCPVLQAETKQVQLAVDRSTALPLSAEIRDIEHAKRVRLGLKMVKSALPAIESSLAAFVAANGGFEIEPGVWYGPVAHNGKRRVDVTVPGVINVMRAHLEEQTEEALSFDTSAAALRRAAKARAHALGDDERGAEGRVFKPLWQELVDLGAVKQGAPYTTVEEKKISRGAIEAHAEEPETEDGEAA
jgi:hypothetical protein